MSPAPRPLSDPRSHSKLLFPRKPLVRSAFPSTDHRALALISRLDGLMTFPSADLFRATWLMREAHCSCLLEGIETTFEEVLAAHAGAIVPAERRDAVRAVLNYRAALLKGFESLKNGEHLSWPLLRTLHETLLGASARRETPDERDAKALPEWLTNEDVNPVLRAAALQVQFALEPPFGKTDGRLDRMLVPLLLLETGMILKPCFYPSPYLCARKDAYRRALDQATRENDRDAWQRFFLEALVEQSIAQIEELEAMDALRDEFVPAFVEATRSSFARCALDYVFANPVFTVPHLIKETRPEITTVGVKQVIKKLLAAGLIEVLHPGKGKRPTIYKFPRLLALLA